MLEPDEETLSRPVLKGGDGRKAVSLPDQFLLDGFDSNEQSNEVIYAANGSIGSQILRYRKSMVSIS